MISYKNLLAALLAAAVFLSVAMYVLFHGQLDEDAYILLQYVKNLSEGAGICFDVTQGRAEGATDFLWMLMLAGLSRLGVDPGTAAAVLNASGMAAIAYLAFRMSGGIGLISGGAVLAVLISGGVAAALGGFSTLAYGALYAMLTVAVIERRCSLAVAAAILTMLFRPDGAILAIGALAVLAIDVRKSEPLNVRRLLLVPLVAGAAYYLWRYLYFGMPLPLPIMIKQRTDTVFEGLEMNFLAIRYYLPLVVPVILACRSGRRREVAAVVSGPVLLFAALSFAQQSQNTGFRFQFPIVLSILFAFLVTRDAAAGSARKIGTVLLLVPGMISGASLINDNLAIMTSADYINSFPQLLRLRRFEVDKIALTECGKFAYWYNPRQMTDLAGLNSPDVAVQGPRRVLGMRQPQLVFVHHFGRYWMKDFPAGSDYLVVKSTDIALNGPYSGNISILSAPDAALVYAQQHGYLAVLVKYGASDELYSHVYFLGPDIDVRLFLQTLEESFQVTMSYYQSRRLLDERAGYFKPSQFERP